MSPPAEIAYYYPEPYWLAREGSWVKSLLLFFDEIAVLLPQYMDGRQFFADPTLAEPMADRGLLRVLHPESFLDQQTIGELGALMEALLARDAFIDLAEVEHFAELSMSRMGLGTLDAVAQQLRAELERRALAQPSADGVSIPLHPMVRSAYLMLLAQLARDTGSRQNLDLHPVTSGRGVPTFERFMRLDALPTRGQVVSFDLEVVSVDLDSVPLDDVLQFRSENAGAHRRYMQHLREFALSISLLDEPDRTRALADRVADLRDEASDLRRRSRAAWTSPKRLVGFGLGLGGAAWASISGDPITGVLGGLGAGLGMLPDGAAGSAYSYLFRAAKQLP
jgi:hypothetical protein